MQTISDLRVDNSAVELKWPSILITLVMIGFIVSCTYKCTIDLHQIYMQKEQEWQKNQWWWEQCKDAEFAENIGQQSTKCGDTQFQSHSDVMWRSIAILVHRYWLAVKCGVDHVSSVVLLCVSNQSLVLAVTFLVMLLLITIVRLNQGWLWTYRQRQKPLYMPRTQERNNWHSPPSPTGRYAQSSAHSTASFMEHTLLHRRGPTSHFSSERPHNRIV